MQRWYAPCGVLLSIGLLGYFIYALSGVFTAESLASLLKPSLVFAIATAALLYALVIPLSAWAWSLLLAATGESWSSSRLAAIMGATQLAKYVPGNFAQHIGRATLALAQGMNPSIFALTVLIETVLAVLSCLLLGLVCWFFSIRMTEQGLFEVGAQGWQQVLSLPLLLLASLALLVLLLPRLHRLVGCMPALERWLTQGLKLPGLRTTALAMSTYALNYVLIGVGMWLVSLAVSNGQSPSIFYLIAVFSVAWLAGFFAPGLPAGLGAREGILLLLLVDSMPHEEAVMLTVAMRLVTILGDLICFVSGLGLLQWYALQRSKV